jgi:hypothetical protein
MAHKPVVSEEMKKFLQDGWRTYGDALLALSEFRSQVRSRLQAVLDEFSRSFSGLGLSVADFTFRSVKLDDPNLSRNSGVRLRKQHSAGLKSGCYVKWDFGKPKDKQVGVGVSIYAGKVPTDRDRFFDALQKKQRSPLSKAGLEKDPDGSSILSSSCDPDQFYSFDETFRTLIEEWVGLLSGDDIKPFLHPASAPLVQPDDEAA